MAGIDPAEEINELAGTLRSIQDVLDLGAMRKQIAELEDQVAAPDLWDDPEQAQKVTSKLSHLQGELNRVEGLVRRLDDLSVLYELAAEESDEDTKAEADKELGSLRSDVGALEVRTLLSGPYDGREALLTINSQAGGVDAADWAEMLLRMYLRWTERRGF
ncbi:MAG TPA: PCRF domain-containing protein, partial [Nonomuraea sp.]|nr:PCRF domain-containing protein [Nonomuraea sp.]